MSLLFSSSNSLYAERYCEREEGGGRRERERERKREGGVNRCESLCLYVYSVLNLPHQGIQVRAYQRKVYHQETEILHGTFVAPWDLLSSWKHHHPSWKKPLL